LAQTAQKKAAQWLHRAMQQQQQGELQKAVLSYSRYLDHDRDNADILHTLGGLQYELRAWPQACACLQRAHELAPDNPDYLNDLGVLYLSLKDYPNATQCFHKLIERVPDKAQAHYNLGLAWYGADHQPEAIGSFEQALRLQPDYAEAWHNLGMAYQAVGRLMQAEKAYGRAVQLEPGLAHTHFRQGEVLLELNRHEAALRSLQRAHALDKKNLKVIHKLAEALEETGDSKGAITLLRGVLAEHPRQVLTMQFLARLLNVAGQFEESEALFRQILSIRNDQDLGGACQGYAAMRKFSRAADSEIITRMEQMLSEEKLKDSGRIALHFALGKIYDDCGEYDAAFRHYQQANTIQSRELQYFRDIHEQDVTNTISIFNEDFFKRFAGMGSNQVRPVIIVGMPRSGTTLTEQIIASHPAVAGAGELSYFNSLMKYLPYLLGSNDPYPFCCHAMNAKAMEEICRHYLDLLNMHSSTALLVTDKMPGNYLVLGLIRILFPRAPLIHSRRDPLDVCLSIYFQHFNKAHAYATDLLDLGHHYLQYARLMAHWRKVLPGPYLENRYEDLVADPETGSRKLIEFCGLEWDERCLSFHQTQRDIKTASLWQARQPVYTSSARRWKRYEKYLEPLKKLFAETNIEL